MFLDFVEAISDKDVSDPYYGVRNGFGVGLDRVEVGSKGLLVTCAPKCWFNQLV